MPSGSGAPPPPTLDVGQLPAEMRELVALATQVGIGNPRPFIERYFKITPDGGGLPIPMLFESEPNQVYYYEQLTGQLRGDPQKGLRAWLVDALCFKDRQARWTAFVAAMISAKFFTQSGVNVLWIANAEDTFNTCHRYVEEFFENMPDYARPEKSAEWGKERKVVNFKDQDGRVLTSSLTLRTANNPNLGTGEAVTDIVFDEYPKFPKTASAQAQSSVRAAVRQRTSLWRGGTVGPDGPDCAMYDEIQLIKQQQQQTKYLFRRWHDNPRNALPPHHPQRRPADILDEAIVAGVDGGLDCEKEPLLLTQFPQDGIPWQHRIAQRRAWMRDAQVAAKREGGDDARAVVLFNREHCEDDVTPWMIGGKLQFDARLLQIQIGIASAPENFLVIDEVINALAFRAWRKYDPTHIYILGMDFGSGSQGDDTSGQLLDATTMTFMGEYHGNVTEPYSAAAGGKIVLSRFGNGVWVPESNRFPGIGNYIHDQPTPTQPSLGYTNVFKSPQRENETSRHHDERPYGMFVSATHHSEKEPSAEELLGRLRAMFNQGAYKVINPNLLNTMQKWDPQRDKHPPDRIAGARLALLGLDMARLLQPVTGAIQRPSAAAFISHRPLVTAGPRHGAGGLWGRN